MLGAHELPRSKLRGIERPNQKTSRGKPRGIEPDEINDRPRPLGNFATEPFRPLYPLAYVF